MPPIAALESASLRCKVPQHLDQSVWEGVQVDVEFAHCCFGLSVSVHPTTCSYEPKQSWNQTKRKTTGLTLDVILGVRIRGFVIMHHLHNLQQIVLVEFLKAIGQLVHVDLVKFLASALTDNPTLVRLTFLSVRFFFFALSSPVAPRLDLTPFSSPGTGPDSRNCARKAGLGFLKV